MFGLGLSEIIVIAVIGLLVIGPDELPKLARNLGRLLNDIKRSTDDFSAELKNEVELNYERKKDPKVEPTDLAASESNPTIAENKRPRSSSEQLELFEQPSEAEKREDS